MVAGVAVPSGRRTLIFRGLENRAQTESIDKLGGRDSEDSRVSWGEEVEREFEPVRSDS